MSCLLSEFIYSYFKFRDPDAEEDYYARNPGSIVNMIEQLLAKELLRCGKCNKTLRNARVKTSWTVFPVLKLQRTEHAGHSSMELFEIVCLHPLARGASFRAWERHLPSARVL